MPHKLIPTGVLLPQPLIDVVLDNRAAPARRNAGFMDRWTIRKLNGSWIAWPTDAGVYVDRYLRREWITFATFTAALSYVLGKVFSR